MKKLFTPSKGIARFYGISTLLENQLVYLKNPLKISNFIGAVVWGQKKYSTFFKIYLKSNDLNILRLEDGFLRSYFPGSDSNSLSLIVDDVGIYYDSRAPSRLENILNSENYSEIHLSSNFFESKILILEGMLSKYNHAPDFDLNLMKPRNPQRVLVVDQTKGDLSVVFGNANSQTFYEMLSSALKENPLATIYVKTHPEVIANKKSGYLTPLKNLDRVTVLSDSVNPIGLIKQMDKVYVVTSGLGFEALLVGKPVICFGVPWYAGWGLTDDRNTNSTASFRRIKKRSVDELFSAAYINYTRYLNPVTHQKGKVNDVINWLLLQKDRANDVHGHDRKKRVIGFGFNIWKASNLKPLFGLHQELVHFTKDMNNLFNFQLKEGESVMYWGARPPIHLINFVKNVKARFFHVEDGFIRSVGLGSDLIKPLSIVLDQRGLYFDATRSSDLEFILNFQEFTYSDLSRASSIKQYIIDHEITKYNLDPCVIIDWRPFAKGRIIILVPGQVEDDASIRLGCTTIRTNLDLIKTVRFEHPSAFIVFKPHPDILSGNRKNGLISLDIAPWVDHIETELSIISCINACDEVHTMTSLSGFDALIRGKKVVTYGQPFYAGWGLTEDKADNPVAFKRRKRKLSIEQLIAGALIYYPIYWDWELKGYTTCEAVLHRIVNQRTQLQQTGKLHQLRVGWLRRQLRKSKVFLILYFRLFIILNNFHH